MAALIKIPGYGKVPLIAFCLGLLLLLFTNATEPQPTSDPLYQAFKKNDSLTGFINYLFDELDAKPVLADKADSLVGRIWRKPATQNEKLAWYELVTNIGYHLLQSGQIRASSAWYEKALVFYRQNQTDKALVAAMEPEEYLYKPLGNNYTRIGDFSKALNIQQMAIAAAMGNRKTSMLPGLYANLATTYFYMRDYASTQDIINKGISALNNKQGDIATLLYNLKTEAWLETGQTDSAIYWNNRALQSGNQNNAGPYLSSLTHKARILNAGGHYQQAIPYLQQAWEIADNAGVKDRAKLSNEIGVALFQLGQPANSKNWFGQTLAFFEPDSLNLYPDYNVTSAMFGLALCYEVAGQTDSASYWSVQAVLNDYYTQQLIDPWLYSKTSIYSNTVHTESAIAWHHNLYEKTGNEDYLLKALWMTELSKGRILMSEQQRSGQWQADTTVDNTDFEELRNDYVLLAGAQEEKEKQAIRERISAREYELSLKGKNFSQVLSAPSYSKFVALLANKRQNHTIISYFKPGSALYTIKADRTGLSHKVDSGSNFRRITGFMQTYFYDGPQAFNNNPVEYFKQSNVLLKEYLPGNIREEDDLIISASGEINLLPLEALSQNADQADYFGAHHAINYQFSLLQLTDPAVYPKASIRYFGFEDDHLGFPALPSAKTEKRFLQRRFKVHFQNAATTADSLFYQSLNKTDIIHLATHAVAGDSMAQSFIVLKNKLYLGQLQYNSSQCPLIVLAACETGKGASQQNEGVISLGRTFISKGVGGALSTRWEADDEATATLLKDFYKNLQTEKYPTKALQKTRAAYLKENTNIAGQNPWLWAALFYQGKDHPIEIRSSVLYSPLLWSLLLLTAASLFIFKIRRK